MMGERQKSALIAGGGLAGLAAAVLLDEQGYAVTLYEKKPILGGRTYSFADKKSETIVDNGQHLMIGAYHETIALLEKVGAKHKVALKNPTVVPLVFEDGEIERFILGSLRPPLGLAWALLKFRRFSFKDKLSFLRMGAALRRLLKGQGPLPTEMTVNQWLQSVGQSEFAIKNFWGTLTLATLNDSPDIASADALVTVLLKSYFAGPRDGHLVFSKVGLTELFVEPILKYLEARGQSVVIGNGVKEVRILNDRVQSFILSDGTPRKADLYVSAMPFHRLLGVLPGPFIESRSNLQSLRGFHHSPIVSVNLFFDRPVLDEDFIGSAETHVHWFFNKGYVGAQKKSYHVMGVVSGAYDFLEKSKDEIVALSCENLRQISPKARHANLVHSLVNIERQATLSCRVGVNALRPSQKMLDNFFIVGDWTKTGLPPTIESAVLSAKLMRDALCGNGNLEI